jgi:hypothetical protein
MSENNTPKPDSEELQAIMAEYITPEQRGKFAETLQIYNEAKLNNNREFSLWQIFAQELVPFLRKVDIEGSLYTRAVMAGIKDALDEMIVTGVEESILGNDIGHHLGMALNKAVGLVYDKKCRAEELSNEVRKLLEFYGQFCEVNVSVPRAAIYYSASYPDKYSQKIEQSGDIKPEIYFATPKAAAEALSKILEEIKDSPLMKIDTDKELREICGGCISIIDSKLGKA